MIYGYARVSTVGQAKDGNSLEVQKEALELAGATEIFCESFTGTALHRPELDKLLDKLKKGDTLVVYKLDRIARNTINGISIIDTVINKGCCLNILNMGVFNDTPAGRLMRTMMLAFAEFERDMIVQRTSEGKMKKRESDPDFHEGRPKKEISDFQKFFEKQKEGTMSVNECCEQLGISRSMWYSRVREEKSKTA
jgi:DNA invertase Pin-like site-specific DNA recombinase